MHTLLDAGGRPLDRIAIDGLRVDCIVGVYDSERRRPQPLVVDLALYLDTRPAARGASLSGTVDYAHLSGEVRFLLECGRFQMLESAAEALLRYLLAPPTEDAPRAQLAAAAVKLTKPEALEGRAVPSVQLLRRAGEFSYEVESKPFGRVDVVHTSPQLGIYRLRIRPGGCIPAHVHRRMEEHELVLGSELLLQGRPVARGTAFSWPHDFVHRYDNPSPREQTVLCVDSPAFLPEDEIEVPVPSQGLQWREGRRYYPDEDMPSLTP